jgi:hypothetical protein
MNIAQTIAQQIGSKALFMIGAKNLVAGKNYLQMRIGRNVSGWNVLKIVLNGLDLYNLTFYKIRKLDVSKEKTVDNIYCDQLCDIIESETGLRTSL